MGRKNIIKILPKHVKNNYEELLNAEQLFAIQQTLDESCVGDTCISKSRLYEELKGHLKLELEQYQFERAVALAIKSKKIVGFETRSGRTGGICREGAFSNKHTCNIDVGGVSYQVPISESGMTTFISLVLNAVPGYHGNIVLNATKYILPVNLEKILTNYIIHICCGKKI